MSRGVDLLTEAVLRLSAGVRLLRVVEGCVNVEFILKFHNDIILHLTLTIYILYFNTRLHSS